MEEYVHCQSDSLVNGSFSLSVGKYYNFVEVSFPCYTNRNGEAIKYEEVTKYTYSFENEYLILSPHDACDEGCGGKHKRVSNP